MRPLEGFLIVERPGRLSTAACGFMLAELGARVVRPGDAREHQRLRCASALEKRLRVSGKECPDLEEKQWQPLLAQADVMLLSPPVAESAHDEMFKHLLAAPPAGKIVCSISARGLGRPDLPEDASDALVQALGGLMAVSGARDGRPEFARVPIAELSAGVIATTSILASLLAGQGRLIDLSLLEIMADQLRSHISMVQVGKAGGYRIGCAHPVCCPWNAYRAGDGWVLICAASDAQWRAMLGAMQRPELVAEERYTSAAGRQRHAAEVDAIVQAWVGAHVVDEVVAAMRAIEVPAGPALRAQDVPGDATLELTGTVQSEEAGAAPAFPIRMTPAGVVVPGRVQAAACDGLPLQGLRVVELTVYAAGPLAGYVLSSLGAEVIKVEPPGGEECRKWTPQLGAVSGYFVNYNAGKRSVEIDLRDSAACKGFNALVATADVLLHNMRPGSMERLGFGIEPMMAARPGLVYCSISGYGLHGPKLAALDTVIQGQAGLTGLVGDGDTPVRVGYSIADQLSGHFAAAGILAALIGRKHAGPGQVVDIVMTDAIAWLTHLAWESGNGLPATTHCEAADGWVVASSDDAQSSGTMTRAELVAYLGSRGIAAAPVLEVDEVLEQEGLRLRASLHPVQTPGGGMANLFAAPIGMTAFRPARLAALGEHNFLLNSA